MLYHLKMNCTLGVPVGRYPLFGKALLWVKPSSFDLKKPSLTFNFRRSVIWQVDFFMRRL